MGKKRCRFFDVCGAEVIREQRGENWRQCFCFADYKKCLHYQDRKKQERAG